ncbi:MAG: hypothetical protein AAGD14_09540, partial [Planctomycetota bacterium]
MYWEELEHHFRAETRPDEPPFGDDVVEWDYSRYTRALGLGRTPGLDTLKRRGCVQVSGRPAFRKEAARHLEAWGQDQGWDFLRVNAIPSTVVPDSVIYHLGIEITHPDSLIFCGAGQQGQPAVGKRPRSPAMRLPLQPEERWLIAADRVRRRLRSEIATRKLILYIDNAQCLTPNALSILSYLLDAQCAWKSHLLSAPAQVYIAFAHPARDEDWFADTLRRFSPRIEPFEIREAAGAVERRFAAGGRSLTIEQDHVQAVLNFIGAGIGQPLVHGLMGSSSVATLSHMADRGFLEQRAEKLTQTWLPDSLSESPELKSTAADAILTNTREALPLRHRAVLGLRWPRSTELSRTQLRALCSIEAAAAALVPIVAWRSVHASTPKRQRRSRALVGRMLGAAVCRDMERFHGCLDEWTAGCCSRASWSSAVNRLLSLGHAKLAATGLVGLFSKLSESVISAPEVDATAVLADGFSELATLSPSAALDRLEVVRSLVSRVASDDSATPVAKGRLPELAENTLWARLALRAWRNSGASVSSIEILRDGIRNSDGVKLARLVAYVSASFESTRMAAAGGSAHLLGCDIDKVFVRDGAVSTGDARNSLPTYFELSGWLRVKGLHLLARPVLDEIALLSSYDPRPRYRLGVRRALLSSYILSLGVAGANQLLEAARRSGHRGSPTWEESVLVDVLMRRGAPPLARDLSRARIDATPGVAIPHLELRHLVARMRTASPQRDLLRLDLEAVRDFGKEVGAGAAVSRFSVAVQQLAAGELGQAASLLRAGCLETTGRMYGDELLLFQYCVGLLNAVRRTEGVVLEVERSDNPMETALGALGRGSPPRRPCLFSLQTEPLLVAQILRAISIRTNTNNSQVRIKLASSVAANLQAAWGWELREAVELISDSAPDLYRAIARDLRAEDPRAPYRVPAPEFVAVALSSVVSVSNPGSSRAFAALRSATEDELRA